MPTKINLIKIGWDLGGAHIKYCVELRCPIRFGTIL